MKKHSHTFAIWMDGGGRQVHRFSHKHDHESVTHRHQLTNLTTDGARYYSEEVERLLNPPTAVDRDGFPR